jgi:hypothetical protein
LRLKSALGRRHRRYDVFIEIEGLGDFMLKSSGVLLILPLFLFSCATGPRQVAQIPIDGYKGRLFIGRIVSADPTITLKEIQFEIRDRRTLVTKSTYVNDNIFVVAEAPSGQYFIKSVIIEKSGLEYNVGLDRLNPDDWLANLSDHERIFSDGTTGKYQIAYCIKKLTITQSDRSSEEASGFSLNLDSIRDDEDLNPRNFRKIMLAKDLGPYRNILATFFGYPN